MDQFTKGYFTASAICITIFILAYYLSDQVIKSDKRLTPEWKLKVTDDGKRIDTVFIYTVKK